ncbi:hypothetical protein RB614_37780 [Phytohabitans sp. ZYX-F-186]|uniref:Uncharacterized protein n=1 Tax=Phytohabitans maris TaxID=3071409 RepID=A0ABU0ZT97_9ACTN|nr:hypothetical protein [Phytohabitans sp. ZYX-F-186]MDQ7910260.1 hypothetical protein [Phytohabitans sp. ZYX-F-186]
MAETTVTSRLPNGAFGQRIAPKLNPNAYRTFEVRSPLSTHWRNATCAEVECRHLLSGWVSRIDVSTEQGRTWAAAIKASGRRYTYEQNGTVVTFKFGPGQQCFQAPHKVRTGRQELYVVRDGDWRGNPTGRTRQHRQPGLFVEEFEEGLSRLRDRIQQG